MKNIVVAISILLFSILIISNNNKSFENEIIHISDDIELIKLSERAYVYISSTEVPHWGKVSGNGLFFVDGKEAFLFDTPWDDKTTETLVNWISDALSAKVTTFVAGHWHGDNIGGLDYLHSIGVKSYANQMTIGN
jgi:metallo-beta-lactamase class B